MPARLRLERATARGQSLGLTGEIVTLSWAELCNELSVSRTTPGYPELALLAPGSCVLRTAEAVMVRPFATCRDAVPPGVTGAFKVHRAEFGAAMRRL